MGTKAAWTTERRARQADLIRQTKPWESSTGPLTEAGRATSARNAYKGDFHHEGLASLASNRAVILEMFGRKRWPRFPF